MGSKELENCQNNRKNDKVIIIFQLVAVPLCTAFRPYSASSIYHRSLYLGLLSFISMFLPTVF